MKQCRFCDADIPYYGPDSCHFCDLKADERDKQQKAKEKECLKTKHS